MKNGEPSTIRDRTSHLFSEIQNHISTALEQEDGAASFHVDQWDRTDISGAPGGGGETRILTNGKIFEKAGVNFSKVFGNLSADFAAKLGVSPKETPFYATGISLVIHPASPMVPTTHANWRYLEIGEDEEKLSWFGGGSDLTPYYLFDEDAVHFHTVLRDTCAKHSPDHYPRFKKWCDEYFYLPHRQEARGIGGIFFDHLGKNDGTKTEDNFHFAKDLGFAFKEQYIPIVTRRKNLPFTESQRQFQLMRRGRYVEFNLLYDRGTHFGLQTNGRIESIFMSLPPLVRWDYCPVIAPDSEEGRLLQVVTTPKEWA